MKIVQFMPYFPPHKWGLETVWEEIGKFWAAKNLWESYIVTFDVWQDISNEENIIFHNWKGIWYSRKWYNVYLISSFDLIHNFPFPKFWEKNFWVVLSIVKSLKVDIVTTNTRFFLSSLLGWFFAKFNKIKWIHIEYWSDYVKLSNKWLSFIAYLYDKILWISIFKFSDKILAISWASKKFINDNFTNKEVDVFYRWIDLPKINVEKKWNIRILFIWRLVALKWVDLLIKAYSKLSNNIELDIIWDWNENQSLINLANDLWLNNKVNFLWYRDKDFIINYLSKNNTILVNPSYQEWMPTTVIEWLFYKNIVVASNVWWTQEISKEDDLLLFEKGNIEQLINKLNIAILNHDKLIWKSKNHINNTFNRDNIILKLYNNIK